MLRRLLLLLHAIVMVLWPVLVFLGLYFEHVRVVGLCLLGIVLIRLLLTYPQWRALFKAPSSSRAPHLSAPPAAIALDEPLADKVESKAHDRPKPQHMRPLMWCSLIGGAIAAVLCLISVFCNSTQALLYYPVVINALFLGFFACSLFTVPIVELFARLQLRLKNQLITPRIQRYTFKVTVVWCGFFVVNGSIALATVLYGDMHYWALYNGFISYILMALLMSGEYLIRKVVENAKD